MNSKPSRRRVLAWSGAVLCAPALGCGDNEAPLDAVDDVDADPSRPHTCVAFEVTDLACVLSVSGEPTVAYDLAIIASSGEVAAQSTVRTTARGVATWVVTGLVPNTRYTAYAHRRVMARFVTAPAPTAPAAVTFTWGADLDPHPSFATALFLHLAELAPDFHLSLGDAPYADNGNSMSADDYHLRHREFRHTDHVAAWMQTTSFRAIYDDHEVRNDWDANTAVVEPERLHAGLATWDEWFPLGAPRSDSIRYRSWRWGAHAEFFLLDTRRHRSRNADPDGPDKTLLGPAQKAWLLAGLAASTATYKFVGTSVPLNFGNGVDHWASFATERAELFAALRAMGISGVVFLSGDHHWFAAHRHGPGLREFQAGPLARHTHTPPAAVDGVVFRYVDINAGVIHIDAAGTLTVRCLDQHGAIQYTETLSAANLAPA